jgi:hypothetical protein
VRPAGSATDVIEEQSSKAYSPMLVRLAGSAIVFNEEQLRKAYPPRLNAFATEGVSTRSSHGRCSHRCS